MRAERNGPLWALTSYFNPMGWRSRLRNYRVFRERLGVPLVAVELATDGRFELEDHDAEVMVRVSGGDVMWQKERLLNVGLGALPASCQAVAWVDCDVVFERADWAEEALMRLESAALVHLLDRVLHLPRGSDSAGPEGSCIVQHSLARALAGDGEVRALLGGALDRGAGALTCGVAWAARREALESSGFYDRCIIGGGDTAFLCAARGYPEIAAELHVMDEGQRSAYLSWAERAAEAFKSGIAAIDGRLLHLWHGDLHDRASAERHRRLAGFGFDPRTDLRMGPRGAWVWGSEKSGLHEYVREYLGARNEDG